VVDFEAIKPANLAILFGVSDELDKYKEEFMSSGTDVFDEIGLMIIIIGVLFFVLLVLGMLYIIKPLRKKMKKILNDYYKEMIWNGTIDIITLGYMNYCLSWWLNLTDNLMNDEVTPTIGNYISCLILGLLIFPYPFTMLYILVKQKNEGLR